jgi:hypothetical protein
MRDFIHFDFLLGMPSSWKDYSIVTLCGPPNDGFSPNIAIMREQLEFQLDSEAYAMNQLASLRKELESDGYKVHEESSTMLGGTMAYRRIHSFRITGTDAEVTQLQVYVIKNSEAITITCSNLSSWFEQTKSAFLESLDAFAFRQ